MNLTIDTYAWIEYFEGSLQGNKIKELLDNQDQYELFTPSIVLVELSDALIKGKIKIDWDDLVQFIKFNTKIVDIDEFIAREAGIIKSNLRKKHTDFGLIDAIILATARITNSRLLTC